MRGVGLHLPSQSRLSLTSCSGCPRLLGQQGLLATHPRRSRESLAEAQASAIGRSHFQGFRQSRCRAGRRRASLGSSRALLPPGPRRPGTPFRAPPAPRLARFLSPSLLPPCGHRGQNCAAANEPRTARATAAATSTVGTWVVRGSAALAGRLWGIQERLRSEVDCGDSCATETPWDLREGSCQFCTAPSTRCLPRASGKPFPIAGLAA